MAVVGRVLGREEEFPLTVARVAIALSWDRVGQPVDVDLQMVAVNDRGTITDAVYYNNMKALKCITHSGDELTGERDGFDEVIWCGLPRLPESMKMLLFVVAVHSGGHLRDVRNGMLHVLEERQENEVARFGLERSEADVDLVAAMVRSPGGAWSLRIIDVPAQEGSHFMDILEPSIGNFIRKVIPGAPKHQKVAFAMEKGAVFDLPQASTIRQVSACLGWDVTGGQAVDLDVSAVCFGAGVEPEEVVYFGKLTGVGLTHSGDNRTGEGDGDDERIDCNLEEIRPSVQQIFFVVNIYTQAKIAGLTFGRVKRPYCRILDSSGTELARYQLDKDGGAAQGLIIARLFREDASRWGFQALGTFCRGRIWKESLPEIVPILRQSPREFQQPQLRSISGIAAAPPGADVAANCCALQ